MKKRSPSGSKVLIGLYVIVPFFLIMSCASKPQIVDLDRGYVWPLPPEKPRIRYVKSLWGEEDVYKPSATDIILGIEKGTADLVKPYGVATDSKGRVYVTDTVQQTVFIFDEAGNKLSFLGIKETRLRVPAGVAVDDQERIYVTDTGHDAVLVFDRSDKLITRFGQDLLDNPSGVAVDRKEGRIYVVSTKAHKIEVFSLAGEHLFGFGGRGSAPGTFNYPTDIAIDSQG
ncbi:MAG: hypothetical protein ACM34I_09595, partial [bacterium]